MKKKQQQFSGFPGDCSPEQLEILSKFRKEVRSMGCSDPPYDDVYLLRFLRARKFDLAKTLEMWRNFIQWRKTQNVDDVRNIDFSVMNEAKRYYPHAYFRTDKLGRPVYIERIGYLKFDHLTKMISLEKLQLYFIQSYERLLHEILPACSRAVGQRVDQTCYIIDLKDAGSKMMSSKMWDILKLASKVGSDYYPETLGNMFIINTPLFFYGIWNIIKTFIDEKTKKKIHILGSKYQKELFEYVSPENLPDFLGGSVTSKDYGDYFKNEQGPWVAHPMQDFHLNHQIVDYEEPEEKVLSPSNSNEAEEPEDSEVSVTPDAKNNLDLLNDEAIWVLPSIPEERPNNQIVRTFTARRSLLVQN